MRSCLNLEKQHVAALLQLVQHEMEQREIDLDNVALGGYTVATMEAYSGKT